MSEALIESRQFIGWWRDAVSDAITSSAYTGERAIHSSDFSAFTKRSHCPSLLQFSGPKRISTIIHLHFGDCLSGTLFSSRWSAMEYRRCLPPCTRFIAREDPHSKCIKCLGISHARDAVYGISKCKICKFSSHNPPLSAWGLWEGIFHLSPSRPRGIHGLSWDRGLSWSRDLGFGFWARGDEEWADRPRLFSPSLSGACSREFTTFS